MGVFVFGEILEAGGLSVPYKYRKSREVGGGGVLSEIISMVGYEYFLEPHNLHKNMMHVQSCCFAYTNPLLICLSCCRLHCHCLSSLILTSKHTFGDWS